MPRMPSAAVDQKPKGERAACETELIYRAWKESNAVRMVALRTDRLFEFPKPKGGGESKSRVSIKNAVHNQYVLIPLLKNMAMHPEHPLPYIKPLAGETLF